MSYTDWSWRDEEAFFGPVDGMYEPDPEGPEPEDLVDDEED